MKLLKGKKKEQTRLAKYDEGGEMPFLEHLEELRVTVIKIAAVVVLFSFILLFFALTLNKFLMLPFDMAVESFKEPIERPRTASPLAPFMIYFQIVVFGALFLSLPFTLYFLAQFILPALTKRERKVLIPGLTAATVLFVSGACMAFFVLLPLMLKTSFRLSSALEISVLYDATNYYYMVMMMTIGVGISFELPLLVVILIYVGILKPSFLRKYRRHIFVLLLIFSAFITPPDPLSLAVIATPLYILYELAVFVGERLLKRKLAQQAAEDAESGYVDPETDARYQEREFKRDHDDIEQSYYLSYEEERKHYPENDGYDAETLTDAAENEAGVNEQLSEIAEEAAKDTEEDPSAEDK